ncbi:MAG: TonB-dependent receptor [Bacteroides graminisolvens]|nr:TonB-dependent receptor [Bacteroides graminisolvens]
MKITAALLFIFLFQANAEIAYSQSTRISLNLNNATVEQVLNAIEENSDFYFLYNSKLINVDRKVDVRAKEKSIESVLNEVFKNTNVQYKVEDKQIILSNKSATIQQQQKTISAVVMDPKLNEPIIGANVVIKGTTNGTITDMDGKFTLTSSSPNDVILISYMGYIPLEIKTSDIKDSKIFLKDDTQKLEEIVVVGYGTQKKVNLTGSVANVDSKLMESRPMTSVSAGLQGLLPGVTVTQRSGQPGSDNGTIRVRGTGTFNNANPMVIVDGVEASMNDLDPNDIQSVSVLKDAASSAIYGSKAANGVILVTTKRGKAGKASINYSANFGWQSPTELPEYVTSAQYATLTNEARAYAGKTPLYTAEQIQKYADGSDPYNYPNTNWQDLLYTESGFQQQHNISINGGDEKVRYMTSVGYQGQDGIIKHASKDQYNVRVNVDANPTSKLESNFSISYSNIALEEPTNPYVGGLAQIFRQVNMISPMVPYKKEDGTYGTIGDGNPIAWIDMDATTNKKRHNMLGVGSLKYSFLPELSIKGQASYKLYAEDSNEMRKDIQYNPNKYHGPNQMWQKDTFEDQVMGDIMLEYKKSFGLHNLNVLAGFHSELYKYKYTMAYRKNFPSNDLTDINAGSSDGAKAEGYTRELAMLSWLGRVNYDYAGKYLLEANIRYDGSSRFADGNRWGAFPSFSAGWRISEEEFFESYRETVNSLKLRASWGMLGNQNINSDYYPTVSTMTLGKNYPMGGSLVSGAYTQYAKNPNLKWEETTTYGVGIDVALIDKLNVTLDYYNKTTSGILMKVPTAETYALADFYDNVGKVENNGFEMSVDYKDRFGKVDFSVGGNISYNHNEIKNLGGVDEMIESGDGYVSIKRVGEAMNSFYGYRTAGLYQSQEDINNWATYGIRNAKILPGDIRYVDVTGDGKINADDRVILNSSDPKFTFGFNLSAQYAGFDVMAFFQGAAGVKGYLGIEAIGSINGDDAKPAALWMDRWTPENKNAKYPRVVETLNGPSMPSTTSDFWLQNANYLRLKNLQVGYTFNKSLLQRVGISKLRVYYSAQNILTFTSFLKGWDPEAPSGRGNFYPQTQVHSVGLNLTF